MGEIKQFLIPGIAAILAGYALTVIIFNLLLRGFSPFFPSRPWVVRQLMDELNFDKKNMTMVAFSAGRSGFFHTLSKKYPEAKLIGDEPALFPYVMARIQSIIRRTRIKIIHKKIHRVNIKNADLIYCHMYPDSLRELSSKFKFECKTGAIIISTGFNIPYLDPTKVILLEDREGKYDFLTKNLGIFQSKQKKFRKEKKAYFYQI